MRLFAPASATGTRRLLEDSAAARTTYDGPSPDDLAAPPPGAHLDRSEVVVGRGDDDFGLARHGLQTWQAHCVTGVRVLPRGVAVVDGGTYVVSLGLPVAAVAAPCRVVAVTDEPRHCGFAYRTLPGHPERGEESFHVELDEHGRVWFRLVAVSSPSGALARLGHPVARVIQRAVSRAYGRSLAAHVRRSRV